MKLNKKKILNLVKKAWQNCYDAGELSYQFPNEILVRFFSPVKNEIKTVLDIGSGPQNNTNWIKNKKILSIDNCFIKGAKNQEILDFTLKKNIIKKKFINNSEFIILNQFVDHQFIEDSTRLISLINKFYIKTKFIFISFLTTKCSGEAFKTKKLTKKTFFSKISVRPNIQDLELHTYFDNKDITKFIKSLSNFNVSREIEAIEKLKSYNKTKKMVTRYFLLKNKEIKQ